MRPVIFISYSHKDSRWLDFVQSHLQVAVSNGHFETWDDRRIEGGGEWEKEIDAALWRCQVFILLVSRHSLISSFILKREVKSALEAHWNRGVKIYPIIVRACDIQAVPWLSAMNVRPRDAKALTLYPAAKREEVMASLVAELRGILSSSNDATTKEIAGTPKPRREKQVGGRDGIGRALEEKINLLSVGTRVQESIRAIATHSGFPIWMSIAGALVKNPVWDGISKAKVRRVAEQYDPAGANPPHVMHLDMLLIRRNNERGHGELYTYRSPDWGTYLLTFRQRSAAEKPSERNRLNATKIARHWSVDASSIEVKPLAGKYAVSVKLHPRYQDLILYVFEFCAVAINDPSAKAISHQADNADEATPSSRWRDLAMLRSDVDSWAVNGDVVRAIHELFTYDLGSLPVSLPR